ALLRRRPRRRGERVLWQDRVRSVNRRYNAGGSFWTRRKSLRMKLITSMTLVVLTTLACAAAVSLSAAARQTMLMNRLGPSAMALYVANADGPGERPLLNSSGFDYNASFSPDGQWIGFTSERAGPGP